MRRLNFSGGRHGVLPLSMVAAAAVVLASSAAASGRTMGGRCNYRVYAPLTHFGIVAKAQFTCMTPHANSSALVVMQNFTAGKWTTVAKKSIRLNVQAGKSYTVKAKWATKADCPNGEQPKWKMRTHFILRLPSSLTINYTTPGIAVYPPCN